MNPWSYSDLHFVKIILFFVKKNQKICLSLKSKNEKYTFKKYMIKLT